MKRLGLPLWGGALVLTALAAASAPALSHGADLSQGRIKPSHLKRSVHRSARRAGRNTPRRLRRPLQGWRPLRRRMDLGTEVQSPSKEW